MVTGEGLASGLRRKFPAGSASVVFALLIANTINVGADLAGMADAASSWSPAAIPTFSCSSSASASRSVDGPNSLSPDRARVLIWLALVLSPTWPRRSTSGPAGRRSPATPSFRTGRQAATNWGDASSPSSGRPSAPTCSSGRPPRRSRRRRPRARRMLVERYGATPNEIVNRRIDVGLGTFFSNVVMFFVILCCATHAAPARHHPDHHDQGGGRGPPAAGRAGGDPLYTWADRRRLPGHPDAWPARRPTPSPRPSTGAKGSTSPTTAPANSTSSCSSRSPAGS